MSGRDTLDADSLFAAWAEAATSAEQPPDRLRRRLLDSVTGAERFRPFAATVQRLFDITESAWAEVVRRIDDATSWTAGFPGIVYFHFQPGAALAGAGAESGVVRLEPGAVFPRHRHIGREMTFVLDGLLLDRDGRYGPGSVVESDTGTEHDYRAGEGRPLLILSLHHGFELI